MPEYVGLQSVQPDIFGKLSQLLAIKQQQQALRTETAGAKSAEQSQRQRAAIAQYDFGKHLDADGLPDIAGMWADPELHAAAGDQVQEVMAHAAAQRQAQLGNIQALTTVRTDIRKNVIDMLTPLRSDKDVAEGNEEGLQKVNDVFTRAGEIYGKAALPILEVYGPQFQAIGKNNPKQLSKAIGVAALQNASADRQLEMQRPNYFVKGKTALDINPLSAPGAAPSELDLTVAPGGQEAVTTDQLGNIFRVRRDQHGNITGASPLGAAPGSSPNAGPAPSGGSPGAGPAHFGVGERETFEKQAQSNFESVNANRQAASMAPQQLDQINKALDLSRNVSTGAWAHKKATIESGIGSLIPGFSGMDDASKLQELDKFSERIATDASRVLGVNATTDAARESIQKQNANIGYTPQAIQAVLKYAKAQTMAMEAKGNAQEAWLSQGNSITKQHEFETAFRKAYDPRVFQFDVMTPKEQDKYLSTLSKGERRTLAEKTKALLELGAIASE